MPNTLENKIVIGFTGPFGAGKTTLMKELIAHTSSDIGQIIRHTSRKQADHEVHGIHYYFETDEKIAQMEKEQAFHECIKNTAGYYATSKSVINTGLQKHSVLAVDIGLDASRILKSNLKKEGILYLDFFVLPGNASLLESIKGQEELLQLLDERGNKRGKRSFETEEELAVRKEVTLRWFEQAQFADMIIENHNGVLDNTVANTLQVVRNEQQKDSSQRLTLPKGVHRNFS